MLLRIVKFPDFACVGFVVKEKLDGFIVRSVGDD